MTQEKVSSRPRLSVVIPSYNSAEYIAETLLSLQRQTVQDFEVIVVDDHSTDDTVSVAVHHMEKLGLRGQVVLRPDTLSKGVSNGRNQGIRLAAAEWICFLDSDDLFRPDKVACTLEAISKWGAECSAFHHAAQKFEDGTGKPLGLMACTPMTSPESLMPALCTRNLVTTATVTARKSLMEEIGLFDTTLHGVEDYMMWLRLAKRTKWFYMADVLTDYRVRKTSLMGGRKMQYYVSQNDNLYRALKKTGEFTGEELRILYQYLFFEGMHYYANQAIDNGVRGDFTKGIAEMMSRGHLRAAVAIFGNKAKSWLLRKAVALRGN